MRSGAGGVAAAAISWMLGPDMSKRNQRVTNRPGRHRDGGTRGGGPVWIYGHHAALAAAANPRRRCRRLVAAAEAAEPLAAAAARGSGGPAVEVADRPAIDALLPPGAVHQGMAVLADPLAEPVLEDIVLDGTGAARAPLVVLDQATDPRNVGAVLRSAAAFGAAAVIVQDRHAPEATGALAKAASGALEIVPMVRVTNVARTLRALQDAGTWCLGFDAAAESTLADALPAGPVALVLGAEGAGLRRLVRETCDALARIPITGVDSLNVSVAAAIALYEATRGRTPPDD